ncbi:MAG: SAM-dependent methyltransferase [Proteobacteria bacterium]|nr:MAG: SAM-dependent methyltransferase [Pseudomonadota bacterium]
MKHLRTLGSADCLAQQKAFENWYQTPLGRALLADQRKVISHQLDGLYGVHQLEMMVSHRLPVANTSAINHRICCVPAWEQDMPDNTLVSASEELSLASDSIDLVILHHTLDFAAAPRQSLREAERVLRSGGYMLIVGFNPMSLWGLMKLFRSNKEPPWSGRFISSRRIEDWLELLDFRIEDVKYRLSMLPWQRCAPGRITDVDVVKPLSSFLGAYYSLLTQKQKGAMTLLKPDWRTAEVIGMPVAGGINKTAAMKETE